MKKVKNEKIGIVIPVANESDTIEKFYKQLHKEIIILKINAAVYIIIDNASHDTTRNILEKLKKSSQFLHVIYEPKNRHVADARVRGFRQAILDKCDFIIEMDCGFSHLPQELGLFIQGYRAGYACIFGVRPLWSSKYSVPLYRRLYSLGGTLLSNLLLGTNFSDMTSGYEGFDKKTLSEILKKPLLSTDYFFQTEMRYKARNYRYKEVLITYSSPTPRVKWNSLYNSVQSLFSLCIENLNQNKNKTR